MMSTTRPFSLSRRSILAAATAIPVAAQEKRLPPAEWPRLGRKLRVGMVGLEGHPGLVYDVVGRHPDLELVAIARDQVPVAGLTRREAFKSTRVYDDFQTMFAQESFDIVGVCNTNGHRAEVIVEAANRGWHVAAEKPVALSKAELEQVRSATEKAGVSLTSLLPMRYEPPLYTMSRLVKQGVIGDVRLMSAQKSYKLGSRADWYKKKELYGSTLQWIGVHMLDLMHWVSGKRFRSAYNYEQNVGEPEYGDMENVSGTVLELENGGVATLNMDYLRPNSASSHGDDRLRVAGSQGILEYRLHDGLLLLKEGSEEPEKPVLEEPAMPLFLEFVLSITQNRPMLIERDEIFHVVEAIIAGCQGRIERRAVRVPV